LKRDLLTLNSEFQNSGFRKSLKILLLYSIVIIVCFCQTLHAQVDNGTDLKTKIVLSQGTMIYSTDADFNEQISSGKVSLENGDVSYKGRKNVLVAVSKKSPSDDFKEKELAEKRKELKKNREKIAEFESLKKTFDAKNLHTFPSQQEIISITNLNHEYLSPGQRTYDLNKFIVLEKQYLNRGVLDKRDIHKYTNYNSKSLDFCYARVFSVRPPPSLPILSFI